MKKEYGECPQSIDKSKLYGFSWMEYVLAIPSPLVAVTGYKANGKPNAAMQSWCTFSGEEEYYCLFSNVSKYGHMYSSLKESGSCVVNFPSKDIFMKCMDTIKNNGYEDDEITASGLTAEPASKVNAPRIKECFLNLECEYMWEKELFPNADNTVICVKVVNVCMDEDRCRAGKLGRYGETGYLYNIRSARDPETGETEQAQVGIIEPYGTYDKL